MIIEKCVARNLVISAFSFSSLLAKILYFVFIKDIKMCFDFSGGNQGEVGVSCDVPSEAKTRSYTVSTTRKTSSPSTSTQTTSTTTKTVSTSTKTVSTSTTTKITAPLTSTKITSPSTSKTTNTTIERTTQPFSSYTVQPTESTSHISNNINTDNSMSFVTTIAAPYSSSIESTQNDPKEMICKYIKQFNYQPMK